MTYTTDYITRGGIGIEISIPLDSQGRPMLRHMTDSERRRYTALMLREELGGYMSEREEVTVH